MATGQFHFGNGTNPFFPGRTLRVDSLAQPPGFIRETILDAPEFCDYK